MNLKTRLFIIMAGVMLIVSSGVGYMGQNFNLQVDRGELYADNFASFLLLATGIAGVSMLISVTRLRRLSLILTPVFLAILIIKNPWSYSGINVGFIENPWFNPGLLLLIAASVVFNIATFLLVFGPRIKH